MGVNIDIKPIEWCKNMWNLLRNTGRIEALEKENVTLRQEIKALQAKIADLEKEKISLEKEKISLEKDNWRLERSLGRAIDAMDDGVLGKMRFHPPNS